MRLHYKVQGFNSDMRADAAIKDIFKAETFFVDFTKDKRGATLSIGSEVDQKQYTIPVDFIIKELKKGGHI